MSNLTPADKKDFGVTAFDGIPVVSTRRVSEVFGKRHDNILRDIQTTIDSLLKIEEPNWNKNFIPSVYKDRGKKYPEYLLTKDGFTLLAMGFTGMAAMRFKIDYINRFNEMEQLIANLNIARLEYPALTDAIKMIHEEPKFYHFSNEADMINRLVLGMPAKQFRLLYGVKKGESIRKYLQPWQIEAIQLLQRFDVGLVVAVPDFKRRKEILRNYYGKLLPQLTGQSLVATDTTGN